MNAMGEKSPATPENPDASANRPLHTEAAMTRASSLSSWSSFPPPTTGAAQLSGSAGRAEGDGKPEQTDYQCRRRSSLGRPETDALTVHPSGAYPART